MLLFLKKDKISVTLSYAGRKPNGLDLKVELQHTFSLQVQFVVKMTVDLFGLTITFKESSEDTHALHPHKLLGHTGIFGTLLMISITKIMVPL